MLIPVGRSGLAIVAGYVGLISILVFPLGPIAILFGVLAMRDINAHPEKHGMGRVIFAFIVGGIATLVLFYFLLKGAFR